MFGQEFGSKHSRHIARERERERDNNIIKTPSPAIYNNNRLGKEKGRRDLSPFIVKKKKVCLAKDAPSQHFFYNITLRES
jgi:hypothetical protein